MIRKKQDETETKKQSQPAEFPDDISIESVAEYERARLHNPWNVQGMQPDKHYFFASQEPGHSPQNVQALKRQGYIVSPLQHDCPDLVLMECPKKLFEIHRAQNLIQDQRNRKQSLEPTGIPETNELGGGIFRLPHHGLTKPG